MQTLDRNALEEIFNGIPAADPPGVPRYIGIFHCQGAPMYPMYVEGSGKVGLRCCLCGNVDVEVPVGSSLIHAPVPIDLKKLNGKG